MSSAKCLVCYSFRGALDLFKVGENIFQVPNTLDPDKAPSFSAYHFDPKCFHNDTSVAIGRIRVKLGKKTIMSLQCQPRITDGCFT